MILKRLAQLRLRSASVRSSSGNVGSEYTSTPNYPPILSLAPREVEKRELESKAEKLKKVHSVEEKLLAINVPRYFGWEAVIVQEGMVPYDFLPFTQHITRTKMIEIDTLPLPLSSNKSKEVLHSLKKQLEKVLLFELQGYKPKYELKQTNDSLSEVEINELRGKAIIKQINRCIMSNLAGCTSHLIDALVDDEPRVEAFWDVGGFFISEDEKKHKKRLNDFHCRSNDRLDDPIDRWIQYFGSPVLQVRSRQPLQPLLDLSSSECPSKIDNEDIDQLKGSEIEAKGKTNGKIFDVPTYKYDPRIAHGLEFKRLYGLTIPGYFPNDRHEYGLLSYHKRNHMLGRPPNFGVDEFDEALHSQAILASYSWLFGQACYQGFSTFNDLTYPLTTQTVITDGRLWSFYAYQLNTTTLYDENIDTNPRQNVCYGTKTMELYHDVQDGKIIGWNDKALEILLSFYLNESRERIGIEMKPYLHPEESLIEHIQDDEKRLWLHKMSRYLYPRRHKYEQTPTIYEWEKIYRIDNETRPMDARNKFYLKGEDPINETKWTDRPGAYVPKFMRKPDQPWIKYEKTFFPDVF